MIVHTVWSVESSGVVVVVRHLKIDSLTPLSIVDSLDEWGSCYHSSTKVTAIQALYRLARTASRVEFDKHLRGVWVGVNVYNFAELAIALGADVGEKLVLPATATSLLPVRSISDMISSTHV